VSVFLTAIAKKAAERWLSMLVLPGVLWVTALIAAQRLGQWPPFDLGQLRSWLDAQAANPSNHALATVLLAAVGLLAVAAGISLVASALGAALQRAWAADGWCLPLAWLVEARKRRWDKVTERLRAAIAVAANPAAHDATDDRAAAKARAAEFRRNALGTSRPERPTQIGERFHAVAVRAKKAYGLDLDLAWPRLWAVLPDAIRTDLAASGDAYAAAARLTAWGLLYAVLAIFWWPAIILGAFIVTCGWVRACATANILADLTETAMDLHIGDLAEQLGITVTKPLTPAIGKEIVHVLRKG
jgi:hypothetical protein